MKSKATTRAASISSTAAAAKSAPVRKPRTRKTVETASIAAAAVAVPISTELVAARAYELFMADGGQHGRDLEHWLSAERELAKRAS